MKLYTIVITAQAEISFAARLDKEIPAFAGMTYPYSSLKKII